MLVLRTADEPSSQGAQDGVDRWLVSECGLRRTRDDGRADRRDDRVIAETTQDA